MAQDLGKKLLMEVEEVGLDEVSYNEPSLLKITTDAQLDIQDAPSERGECWP